MLSLGTRGGVLRSVAEIIQGAQRQSGRQRSAKGGGHVFALSWDSQGMTEGNAPPSDDGTQVRSSDPGVATHGSLAGLGYQLPRDEVGSDGAQVLLWIRIGMRS